MRKLVPFVLLLCLGLFAAPGCKKETGTKTETTQTTTGASGETTTHTETETTKTGEAPPANP